MNVKETSDIFKGLKTNDALINLLGSKLFVPVSKLQKMKVEDVIDQVFACNAQFRQCPFLIDHGYVELGPSKIHGKGVFATQTIPADTQVTFYPCDAVYRKGSLYSSLSSKEIFRDSKLRPVDYSIAVWPHNDIQLTGNPSKTDNPLFLGHMINDAVGNVFHGLKLSDVKHPPHSAFVKAFTSYYTKGREQQNCAALTHSKYPIVSIRTTKKVQKGEELLMLYDAGYWFDQTYKLGGSESQETYEQLLVGAANNNKQFFMFLLICACS
jgi:hypothetical protein